MSYRSGTRYRRSNYVKRWGLGTTSNTTYTSTILSLLALNELENEEMILQNPLLRITEKGWNFLQDYGHV
jgi:hypothetical protein